MSRLDDITLLCEGVDQGLDVDLLEQARSRLQAGGLAIAARVTVRPAGSKGDLQAAIRAHRRIGGRARVLAIRDRDFLPRALLEERRREVFDPDQEIAFP